MNEPIKAGDLVVVVKPCRYCGNSSDLGFVFRVVGLFNVIAPMDCCGHLDDESAASDDNRRGAPLSLLKRIPPLSELESIHNEEKAPA